MRNSSTAALWRIFIIFALVVGLTEYFYKTGADPAFLTNRSIALFLVLLFFLLVTLEGIFSALYRLGTSESELAQAKSIGRESNRIKDFIKRMWNARPIEQEKDILLDHDYDGIKELDNSLPPWWLYSFYLSLVFAVLYMGYYHLYGGDSQIEEYTKQIELARIEVEKYKRANPVVIDKGAMSNADNLAAGKKLFVANCAACHAYDGGGGIGPNLTDDHWILGGGAENIYKTIADGGRDGKGMIAWKNVLNAEKMQQVTSFVLSLNGTFPEKPKDKEGELWEE